MERILNVLFLCTDNSARSILAEAILNKHGDEKFHAYSAGSHPKGHVHPDAIQLLKLLGYDTSDCRSKSWDEFTKPGAPQIDHVITVGDNAAGEASPVWPRKTLTTHWGIPDPAAVEGSLLKTTQAFVDAHRLIEDRIFAFLAPPSTH